MSVLRKKIDKNLGAPKLDETKLQRYWADTEARYLAECEALIEHLHWVPTGITATQGTLEGLKDALPEKGLYIGFGPDEKESHGCVLLDTKLAAIIAKHGFSGRISNFENLDAYEVSKLDMLLMNDFVTATQKGLIGPSWGECSYLTECAEVPFPASLADFVQIDFAFDVSFSPTSDVVSISLKLLLPVSYMLPELDNFTVPSPKEPDIELDVHAEVLSRHIDQSVTSLRAVLESCKMTVADCTRLEIGQIIRLPGVSLQDMRLEAEFRENRVCVAKGALGIHKTKRAVRLAEDLAADFIQNGPIVE